MTRCRPQASQCAHIKVMQRKEQSRRVEKLTGIQASQRRRKRCTFSTRVSFTSRSSRIICTPPSRNMTAAFNSDSSACDYYSCNQRTQTPSLNTIQLQDMLYTGTIADRSVALGCQILILSAFFIWSPSVSARRYL